MSKERRFEFVGSGFQALGWGLYYILLSIFIIPTAWGAASLYRWMMRNLKTSDGTKVTFMGEGSQIWGYFALSMALGFLPTILARVVNDSNAILYITYGSLLFTIPLSTFVGLKIINWFVSNIKFQDGTTLKFTGKYLPYLGWMVLLSFSIITIIGWAWVYVAFIRWLCYKTESENNEFDFQGSGWGLLWRMLLAGLASIFIIPIPWVYLWVFKWGVSNLVNTKETDSTEGEKKEAKVFFCFAKADTTRAGIVRASWQVDENQAKGFINATEFEQILNLGEAAIKGWIDEQLNESSVTVVLVGKDTCADKWVAYTIEKSIKEGKGLLGIDVSRINDANGNKTERCAKIPEGYPFYLWNKDVGKVNIGKWISKAAKEAAG